jgi:Protein of unknown function (DUF1203)
MTYRLQGLDPVLFTPLFDLSDAALADRRAVRVTAEESGGYPCRVSLEDAGSGECLILTNHVSLDTQSPFRATHAIYVRANAERSPDYENRLPAMLDRRTLSLRGFDGAGMLRAAAVAAPGEGDRMVRDLFDRPDVATIHAHNAAHGCFLAAIERS